MPGDLTEEERRTIAQKHYKQWLKSVKRCIEKHTIIIAQEDDMIEPCCI
ncbi:hypothetical protein P4S72_24145 [Vibrio sp. PP-XX7]